MTGRAEQLRASELRYAKIKAAGKDKPETISEAQTWESTKNKYLGDGLCHRCASQAAWGHQNGFSLIHPPCQACAPIVAMFPVPAGKGSPWRRWPRGDRRPKGAETPRPLATSADLTVSGTPGTPAAGAMS